MNVIWRHFQLDHKFSSQKCSKEGEDDDEVIRATQYFLVLKLHDDNFSKYTCWNKW
jgi:hypothetical protein